MFPEARFATVALRVTNQCSLAVRHGDTKPLALHVLLMLWPSFCIDGVPPAPVACKALAR